MGGIKKSAKKKKNESKDKQTLSLLLRLAARQTHCTSVHFSAVQCSAVRGKQDPSDNLSLPLLTTAAAKPCPLSDNPIISLSLTQAEITVYTNALGMIIYMAHNKPKRG